MTTDNELEVAVVGVGRLGSAHARVYSELPGCSLVAVVDVDGARAKEIGLKHGAKPCSSLDELPELDAVSIVAPTTNHHELAKAFLEKGVATLVEKPMTKTVAQAEELLEIAATTGAPLQVGHIERFNPIFSEVLPHVKEPRFIECRRISPFPFRSTDVSVVHDVMIHDIDLVLHIAKSPVKRVDASGSPVLSRTEDVANARIFFESGLVADVTASRISMKSERKLRVFGRSFYASLDLMGRNGMLYLPTEKLLSGEVDIESMTPGDVADPTAFVFQDLIKVVPLVARDVEPLAIELESFLSAARRESEPVVDGHHGLAAIKTAEMILKAVSDGDGS